MRNCVKSSALQDTWCSICHSEMANSMKLVKPASQIAHLVRVDDEAIVVHQILHGHDALTRLRQT
eukprot:6187377-Pleurochrysis_carterae.AAC.1